MVVASSGQDNVAPLLAPPSAMSHLTTIKRCTLSATSHLMTTRHRTLAAVILSVLATGCVDDSVRRAGDASADAVQAGPPCAGNEDCARFANACNDSVCVDQGCRSEPVVCDDHSACTTDRCDATLGCVFEAREAGTPCLADRSEACEGQVWHRADRCDAAGSCIDGGVETCDVVGAPVQCQTYACVAADGCALVPLSDGSGCVQGGRSDTCVDGVRYLPDECVQGTCVEGGSEPCPANFCTVPACEGRSCSEKTIGVDVDITGSWEIFQLLEDDVGMLQAARLGVSLNAAAEVLVERVFAARDVPRPDRGTYCIATDNSWQLSMTYDDGSVRTWSGRASRGRDFAVLSEQGRDGVIVLVKSQTMGEAQKISGSYRIIGLDRVVSPAAVQIDSVLGFVSFDTGWCVAGGGYTLGLIALDVQISTQQARCLVFSERNAIAFDVDASGDLHRWAGLVGPGGHYAVLQRVVAPEDLPQPSLVVLVREGVAGAFSYNGDYATTRVDVTGISSELTLGEQTVDGLGHLLALAEPGWSLGPDDEGHYDVSDVAPLSAVIETVTIAGTTRKRIGQLGPSTTGKVDWFVDLATHPTTSTVAGPPLGASLRIGVRVP